MRAKRPDMWSRRRREGHDHRQQRDRREPNLASRFSLTSAFHWSSRTRPSWTPRRFTPRTRRGIGDREGRLTPVTGDFWYPHVYMTVTNPWDPTGTNPFGRWFYGPWFNPPTPTCVNGGPVGCIEVGPVPNTMLPPARSGTAGSPADPATVHRALGAADAIPACRIPPSQARASWTRRS